MRDLVPESEYGRFFGRRTTATTALATALALLGGVLIDELEASCAGTFCIRLFLFVHRQCGDRPFAGFGYCRLRRINRCHRTLSARTY